MFKRIIAIFDQEMILHIAILTNAADTQKATLKYSSSWYFKSTSKNTSYEQESVYL